MKALYCLAAIALCAQTGCRSGGPTAAKPGPAPVAVAAEPIIAVPAKDRYKVVSNDPVDFFHLSPLQPEGADMQLKKDAHVTMVRHGRGFCQIKTVDGKVGFVGTDQIAPLTADEVATDDAATVQAAQAAAGIEGVSNANVPFTTRDGRPSTAVHSQYSIPPEAGNNERLPEADAKPKPTPTPGVNFR